MQGDLKDLSDKNYQKLKRVLSKRGFDIPLFVWNEINANGHITPWLMDGHQRQRVMLGEDMQPYEVPYIVIEAKHEQEAKAKLLEITSQYGTITQDGFDAFTAELPELELQDIHFDALGETIEDEPEVVEDEPPEVSDEPPVSRLGEIYQLGRHRVMCGDSINLKYVEELMGGVMADIVVTDPPYNTGMTEKSQTGKRLGSTWLSHMFNDSYTNEDFLTLLTDSIANMYAVTKGQAAFYVFIDWRSVSKVKDALENMMPVSNVIVWDKMVHGLGSDYKYTYELIVVGKKGKPEINNRYGRDYQDIWHVQRKMGRNNDHATAKPIEILTKPILHASKEDDIVLDLFGGSGSTLIAAEQLNRTCYTMELSERYCDVIRKRYATFIGEEDWIAATPQLTAKEQPTHA